MIVNDRENSVFAWARFAPGHGPIVAVCNFTPVVRENYRVPLPAPGEWREILNTDGSGYGGSGKGNGGGVRAERREGGGGAASMLLPPLATVFLEHIGE